MSDWLDAEAHADRALEMYERGRWAEAEAELRKALSLNPDNAEWHYNLGLTLEAAGRDREALETYRRTVELMPDQVEPLVAAGSMANRLHEHPLANRWLQRAMELDDQCEAAYIGLIESHLCEGQHDDAETVFYLAQHALKEPSARCFAAMAESLIQRQLWDRAQWCLMESLRLDPTIPRLRARLAAVLTATGKPQRALHLYLKELRDDPGNIDTLLDYGDLLVELGRLPDAGEKFRRVLELEPANPEAHFRLGQIAMSGRRYEQAALEFELVLKLDSQFAGVRMSLGEALLRRGFAEEARTQLNEEYELLKSVLASAEMPQPSDGEAPAEASTSDAQQLEINLEMVGRLGGLLLEVEQPTRAAALFELVVSRKESAEVLRNLALARFQAGDRQAGVAASLRVLRLEPDCVRSIHNLALAALQAGDAKMAAGWVRRGLRVNKHDDGLRRVRMRVYLASIRASIRDVSASIKLRLSAWG